MMAQREMKNLYWNFTSNRKKYPVSSKNISPELTSAKQDLKNTCRSAIRYAALHCYLERLKQRTDEATKVTQNRKLCTLYGGHILMKETKDFVVNLSGTDISKQLYIYIY